MSAVPSILLKKLKPSIWFSVITIGVGICMACQGVVHNDSGLIATRWFLGVAEAGLFPGVNYLMRGWYRNGEFSIRAAIFFSAASLAGAFGGLLAAAINQMNGVGGYAGWRWIFIIIGLVTFVAGSRLSGLFPTFPRTPSSSPRRNVRSSSGVCNAIKSSRPRARNSASTASSRPSQTGRCGWEH